MDIAAGMDYLHSLGVLHSDLKAANVLLTSKQPSNYDPRGFVCKVTDFGLSRCAPRAPPPGRPSPGRWRPARCLPRCPRCRRPRLSAPLLKGCQDAGGCLRASSAPPLAPWLACAAAPWVVLRPQA